MEMDFISRNLPHHDHDFWNRDQHNYDFSKSPLGHQHQNNFSEYSSSQINDFSKSPTRSSLGLKDSAANTCSRSNSSIIMLNPRTTPLETCLLKSCLREKSCSLPAQFQWKHFKLSWRKKQKDLCSQYFSYRFMFTFVKENPLGSGTLTIWLQTGQECASCGTLKAPSGWHLDKKLTPKHHKR